MTTADRATVGLDADDVAAIEKIKDPDSFYSIALDSLIGTTMEPPSSKAQLVHAIFLAGRKAIADRAEEIGYRRLAEFNATDPDHQKWRASRRARVARRHTGEPHTA